MDKDIKEMEEMFGIVMKGVTKAAKELRESEPRYSITELEKVWEYLIDSQKTPFEEYKKIFYGENSEYIEAFLKFLKNSKKMEVILND